MKLLVINDRFYSSKCSYSMSSTAVLKPLMSTQPGAGREEVELFALTRSDLDEPVLPGEGFSHHPLGSMDGRNVWINVRLMYG